MRMIDGALRLSASDLMRFKGCRHATTLDLRMMEVGDLAPADDGAEAELLQRQGDAHELAFLDELKGEGRSVVEIPKDNLPLEASVGLGAVRLTYPGRKSPFPTPTFMQRRLPPPMFDAPPPGRRAGWVGTRGAVGR